MNISITSKHKIAGGDILNKSYLENFSTKYYQLLKIYYLWELGPVLFIPICIGIQMKEILLENGFMNMVILISLQDSCSHCGKMRSEKHINHTFNPARFFTFTGQIWKMTMKVQLYLNLMNQKILTVV